MKRLFRSLFIIFLFLLWPYSFFQVYNLSALYEDQVGMGEFSLNNYEGNKKSADYIRLSKDVDDERIFLNVMRVIFGAYIIGFPIIGAYALYRQDKKYKIERQTKVNNLTSKFQ